MTEIVESMSNPDRQVIYIFAGYDKDLQRLFKANKGFERRLGYTLKFNKPTISQLMEIFIAPDEDDQWKMPPGRADQGTEIFSAEQAKVYACWRHDKPASILCKAQAFVLNCFP